MGNTFPQSGRGLVPQAVGQAANYAVTPFVSIGRTVEGLGDNLRV